MEQDISGAISGKTGAERRDSRKTGACRNGIERSGNNVKAIREIYKICEKRDLFDDLFMEFQQLSHLLKKQADKRQQN